MFSRDDGWGFNAWVVGKTGVVLLADVFFGREVGFDFLELR